MNHANEQKSGPVIVVTGATGNLGKQLVPLLVERGAQVIVAGRDLSKLQEVFPGQAASIYDDLSASAADADLLIHLAVLNNDIDAPLSEFERVNVQLTMRVADTAQSVGIPRMLNISSTHALDERIFSNYARTKRQAVDKLKERSGIAVTNLYLPAILGDTLSGKLGVLNKLPRPLRAQVIELLSALKPTVRVDSIAQAIWDSLQAVETEDRIVSEEQSGNPYFRVGKRVIDLLFAVSVLVLFWWLLLGLGIAIRLQSSGPAIFAQDRVGRHGKTFVCYKFRTMHKGTPSVGTHDAPSDAVTLIGRFMRPSKLDELPQVWNILRNEVSLVGPRPCLPSQTRLVDERRRRGVLEIKPGISGYAQINAIDMSDPTQLAEWDARYFRLQCIFLDIKIILATIFGSGGGDRTTRPC